MSIKSWKSFNESVNDEIPEITSLDSPIFDTITFNKISRELTDNELKLVDEYVSKFEKVFLLNEEDIKNILLDLDLINNTTRNLNIKIERFLVTDDKQGTSFDGRNEIINTNSFISLKRWYDRYINKPTSPIDIITISNKLDDKSLTFDNIEVYKYIEMIKGTIEDMCDCKVELEKGGPYQIQFRIKYPKTIIK